MPYYTFNDSAQNAFPDTWLNAGYLDGHVEKFHTSKTNHVKNSNAEAWLTRKYK
jgi:prepilin-type processing-associated H-X9-DG protein